MTRALLLEEILKKKSYLCVGLDTDLNKIPSHLLREKDPVFEFNKQIIDATIEYCVAYKPNLAFYEALGPAGWESLQKTVAYLPANIFKIADAKRADIGNTSTFYARAFFEKMSFDAVTVAPYMGEDSVKPFLNFKDKWVILLAHTSNPGSSDFQLFGASSGKPLYEEVIMKSQEWGSAENLMYVVGATQADKFASIRKMAQDHFFLVPGVGAQGGDLRKVSAAGLNRSCGLLINASRSIIYKSSGKDFGLDAGMEAKSMKLEMSECLDRYLSGLA
jgi:orotidine-5'-phosphate decarboxylase